jgi:CHAT domain-containing protein/Tfp pilus assembly protein PilF
MFRPYFLKSANLLILSLWLLLAVCFCDGQTAEPGALETGKANEREIAGGQKQVFRIALKKGQFAGVFVEQRGIDVLIRAFAADGKLIAEFDAELRSEGTEKVPLAAAEDGVLTLEVEAKPKNAPAAKFKISVSELRPATESDFARQEALNLMAESRRLERAGNYMAALPPLERALAIREKTPGTEIPAVAIVLNRLGMLTFSLGDLEKSESFFERANAIYEKLPNPNELDAADTLGNLAVIYKIKGDFIESEKLQRRVLAVREKVFGTDHNLVASSYNNLGLLYRKRGDNAKAEEMYRRSLEIRERLFGADGLEVTPVLLNISSLNYFKGDYETALVMDRRILAIREKNLKAGHPDIATALDNLALTYIQLGDYQKAEPLLKRALEIYGKNADEDNVNLVSVLQNLARLYSEKGEFEKAEPLYRRAVQISEKKESLLEFSIPLKNLGDFYTLRGNYGEAEPLFRRALEIKEKFLGENHSEVGFTCDALARLYFLKAAAAPAIKMQECANRVHEQNLAPNIAVGTEHQKLSYMALLAENLDRTIALHLELARDDRNVRDAAATALLQRKGRVLDALTDNLAALRRRFDANDKILIDRLNDTNARFAELVLNAPETGTLAEYQKQISALEEEKKALENEIGRRSGGFYEQAKPVTLAAVKNAIPADAALIEFAVYRPLDPKKTGRDIFAAPRYVAYVIRRQGEVGWAEIGTVKEVDALIEAFRRALRDPKREDFKTLARALDEKIMFPVRPLLGDAKQLLVSPDGELSLIPFESLVDEKDRFLIENYLFTYLTSGRDLLRMQTSAAGKNNDPLIVAAPAFGETAPNAPVRRGRRRAGLTAARSLSETFFVPLAGTLQEARAIRAIFPDAAFLTGTDATETALKEIAAPQILHLATHGFFLEAGAAGSKTGNPLLRAGLALAGANARTGEKDDGILTALEASGLNLWGTKLVVLSACDTGLGEVRNGEGVYGLRRAFVLAGTESLVMSLWSVSDFVTRELMTNYYKNLKQGLGRGAALRQVRLEMLKKPNRRHPFYWAGFIQSGEWANLAGRR